MLRPTLTASQLKEIFEQEMLTDNFIHVFQSVMKNQFSDVNGLQDPILREKFHFNVYRSIPFVQVLHDGRLHWAAISSYGCAQ